MIVNSNTAKKVKVGFMILCILRDLKSLSKKNLRKWKAGIIAFVLADKDLFF